MPSNAPLNAPSNAPWMCHRMLDRELDLLVPTGTGYGRDEAQAAVLGPGPAVEGSRLHVRLVR